MTYEEDHRASEWVTLSEIEWRGASLTGVWIWEKSQRDGRSDRDEWEGFAGGRGKKQQSLGSLCERIAARCLGIYWPSAVDNFSDPDLPHNVEVRLIGVPHYGLRVYPRNDDSRRVIGVVVPRGLERGDPPGSYRYRVAGWYNAGHAKKEEWKMDPHDRPPMFCVPQGRLHHPRLLRELIAHEKLREVIA